MAKKKQSLVNEGFPVEETVKEEVLEEAPQIEENDTTIDEEPVSQEEPVETPVETVKEIEAETEVEQGPIVEPIKEDEVPQDETQETVEEKVEETGEFYTGEEPVEPEKIIEEELAHAEDSMFNLGKHVVEPEKIIEEFTDAAKNIDEFVTNDTTQEELEKKLEEELAHAEDTMAKLEKHVADLEKKAKPKTQNGSFARFWMGSSDGWFN